MDRKFLDYVAVKKLESMPTKLELIATIARLINQVGRWGLRLPLGCSCSWHSLPCWGSDASPPRRGNRGAHCPWTRLRRVLSPASFLLIPPPSPHPPNPPTSPRPPQVPTKLARGINQVPTKLAYGVKALADGDDDTSKAVSAVFPKPA